MQISEQTLTSTEKWFRTQNTEADGTEDRFAKCVTFIHVNLGNANSLFQLSNHV
jgi:hypothetical protein